jgi:hypothetical protein
MAPVLEKHLHYVDLYAVMLENKIDWMEFANKIRIQLNLVKNIKQNTGRILIAITLIAVVGKIIGYRTMVLILFGMYIIQPVQARKPTTLQGLHSPIY